MQVELHGNPDHGHAELTLAPDESLLCESGAMDWMDPGIELRARMVGGLGRAVLRRALGGQSLLLGEYRAAHGGRIGLSPRLPGALLHQTLGAAGLWLTAGSYVASSEGVDVRPRFGGLKSLFSGEGVVLFHCTGQGELLFGSYGAIFERQVEGELIVDSGHLVAFEEGLDYSIGTLGGLKQTFFSGEGLVLRFSGAGRVWLQSSTLRATAGWITPFLRA